jgi:hypothetical protein
LHLILMPNLFIVIIITIMVFAITIIMIK